MPQASKPAGRGEIIDLDGKQYTLVISVIALAALQDHWELESLTEVQTRLQGLKGKATLDDLIVIFWAGLQREHPDVSLDVAKIMADDLGLSRLVEAIGKAMVRGSPPAKPTAPGAAKNTPGKRG